MKPLFCEICLTKIIQNYLIGKSIEDTKKDICIECTERIICIVRKEISDQVRKINGEKET